MDTLDIHKKMKMDKLCRDCSKELWNELKDMRGLSKKLDAVIESSYDGIYITDGEARTLRINKSYERITGLDRKKMIGRTMYEIEKDKLISKSSTLMVLKNKTTTTIQQKLSTGKTILVTGTPVLDENGKIELVVTNVRDVTELIDLREEVEKSKKEADRYYLELKEIRKQMINKECLVVKDYKSKSTIEMANRVAKYDTTILITGETGVGKEILAKYIHKESDRSCKQFIKVNCGAIPKNLMESELFGYEKGTFRGTKASGKMGLFEVADGGTIFLDEIGELTLSMQGNLLRVLQEQEIQRVGSPKIIPINVRVIAAINIDLEDMVKRGTFREDLFHILNIIPIEILPLRERKEDIIPLTNNFLDRLNEKYSKDKRFSQNVYDVLYNYHWSGNVRELKNVVERAFIMSNDESILDTDFPEYIRKGDMDLDVENIMDLKKATEILEAKLIKKAFDNCKNVRDAAKTLGISPATFVRKRRKYEK